MQKQLENFGAIQGPLDELTKLIPSVLLEMRCCFNDIEALTSIEKASNTKRRYLSFLLANFQTFIIGVYDAKAGTDYTVEFDINDLDNVKNNFDQKIWYILKHVVDGYVDFLNGMVRDLTVNKLSRQALTKKYKTTCL